MYKIDILPVAKNDIEDIIYYVCYNLKNVTASKKIIDLFMKSFDNILEFPYGSFVYMALKPLKNEYRVYMVKKYLIFYTIDDKNKLITIVRVLYQKMNISNILE